MLFVPPVVAGAEEVAAAISRAVAAARADKPRARGRDQRRGHPGRAASTARRRRVRLPGVGGARARARRRARRVAAPPGRRRSPSSTASTARPRAVVDGARRGDDAWLDPAQTRALLEAYGIPLVPERVAATRRRGRRRRARARLPGRRQDGGGRRAQDRDAAASRSTCATRTQVRAAVERIGGPVLVQPIPARRRRAARGRRPGPGLRAARRVRPRRRARRADRRAPASGSRRSPTSTPRSSSSGGKAGRLVARLPRRAAGRRGRAASTSSTGSRRLADDLPEVAELDLNPVLACPDGCVAVDARVRLRDRPSERTTRKTLVTSRASSSGSTPTGARRTTSRSGRSTCSTTRCCASRSRAEHVKPRLLGHWGTTPGLNLVYAHLNRVIRARDLDAIYVTGPGPRRPGLVANAYLEGTYSELYPHIGAGRGRAAARCSASSRSRAASRATSRPRRRARSTRAASSATRSRTRTAPRSTTPTCSSRASSATARRRPGRSRRAGTRTSS